MTMQAITEEARTIIRMVSRARQVDEDVAQHKPSRSTLRTVGEIADELLEVGPIAPGMRPVDAFQHGLKFWAMRVATEITFDQWEDLTEKLAAEFASDPNVDVIGFMEALFDGREMKDGQTVWA